MTDELRDIDRQVAEAITAQGGGELAWQRKARVFHCNRAHYATETRCRDCGTKLSDDGKYEPALPLPFSTDPRAAWMLLEWLIEKKEWDVRFTAHITKPNILVALNIGDTYGHGLADDCRLALCRAFLKAVGK